VRGGVDAAVVLE
jgi:acetyl esterase